VLAAGILAVSAAALFVRFAQRDAPSLAIAAMRLALAAVVLAPVAVLRHGAVLRTLRPRDLAGLGAAGALLAAHFGTWIASLERTSVVSSVVLVTTTPLWVALLAAPVLGERVPAATRAGLALAVAGGAVLALGGRDGGARSWTGDALALVGAWAMAGYLLAGRGLRARLPFLAYVAAVYAVAAVVLLAAAAVAGAWAAPLPPRAWGWIALLAFVPQLVGHTAFNWALRHLPATFVAVVLLGEPVGAALLAFVVLGERPAALEAGGAALVLAGIAAAARGAGGAAAPPAPGAAGGGRSHAPPKPGL